MRATVDSQSPPESLKWTNHRSFLHMRFHPSEGGNYWRSTATSRQREGVGRDTRSEYFREARKMKKEKKDAWQFYAPSTIRQGDLDSKTEVPKDSCKGIQHRREMHEYERRDPRGEVDNIFVVATSPRNTRKSIRINESGLAMRRQSHGINNEWRQVLHNGVPVMTRIMHGDYFDNRCVRNPKGVNFVELNKKFVQRAATPL